MLITPTKEDIEQSVAEYARFKVRLLPYTSLLEWSGAIQLTPEQWTTIREEIFDDSPLNRADLQRLQYLKSSLTSRLEELNQLFT